MDYTKKSPVILSLCTGMRGLERGIERVFNRLGWQQPTVGAYLEIEAFIIENLVRQMEQGVLAPSVVWTNLKTFPSEHFRGKIHGITGGYPCQPFSNAGKREGVKDPRHLWPYIKGIIGTVRPVWCFFENVSAHLELGYREVRSDLEALGYTVEEGIYSAQEVGAPHLRKRLFILAVENSARERWRGRSNERGDGGRALQAQGPGALDNSDGIGHQSEHEVRTRRNGTERSSENLADSDRIGLRTQTNRSESSSGIEQAGKKLADTNDRYDSGGPEEIESTSKEKQIQKRDNNEKLSHPGSAGLADSDIQGLQSSARERLGEISQEEGEEEWRELSRIYSETRWPARPGEEQYPWEAPRTESRVGYAINGHNFIEDLLRMAGNAVVEQQSERAFRNLLEKHGIHLNL